MKKIKIHFRSNLLNYIQKKKNTQPLTIVSKIPWLLSHIIMSIFSDCVSQKPAMGTWSLLHTFSLFPTQNGGVVWPISRFVSYFFHSQVTDVQKRIDIHVGLCSFSDIAKSHFPNPAGKFTNRFWNLAFGGGKGFSCLHGRWKRLHGKCYEGRMAKAIFRRWKRAIG